ncbi:hypothetical protein EG68_10583 [Paragonimus skrjabini miyazakii]|uniref:Uncharacterized protein n=1 Tax=Paragonimus skrjabini miyazakii TaxID=59628 RepID=A0A8S9YRH8_9TREM|nr:hypothetical protein EG68_10583 [Paragonimus skrjabini miyazakii]
MPEILIKADDVRDQLPKLGGNTAIEMGNIHPAMARPMAEFWEHPLTSLTSTSLEDDELHEMRKHRTATLFHKGGYTAQLASRLQC